MKTNDDGCDLENAKGLEEQREIDRIRKILDDNLLIALQKAEEDELLRLSGFDPRLT